MTYSMCSTKSQNKNLGVGDERVGKSRHRRIWAVFKLLSQREEKYESQKQNEQSFSKKKKKDKNMTYMAYMEEKNKIPI